jgi:hypothetical protein
MPVLSSMPAAHGTSPVAPPTAVVPRKVLLEMLIFDSLAG